MRSVRDSGVSGFLADHSPSPVCHVRAFLCVRVELRAGVGDFHRSARTGAFADGAGVRVSHARHHALAAGRMRVADRPAQEGGPGVPDGAGGAGGFVRVFRFVLVRVVFSSGSGSVDGQRAGVYVLDESDVGRL